MSPLTANTLILDNSMLRLIFTPRLAEQIYAGSGMGMIRQYKKVWFVYLNTLPHIEPTAIATAYHDSLWEIPADYEGFQMFVDLVRMNQLPAEPFIQMLGRIYQRAERLERIYSKLTHLPFKDWSKSRSQVVANETKEIKRKLRHYFLIPKLQIELPHLLASPI